MPFEINKKGYWINKTYEGHWFDKEVSSSVVKFLAERHQNTICDLGCGPGWYVKILRENGFVAYGFDGNPYTPLLSEKILGDSTYCVLLDLTKKIEFEEQFDTVLSLEVGEHIPQRYEQIFLDNITSNAKNYVILSWAVEGQLGDGHVNCRNNEYIINQMGDRGFLLDQKTSESFRMVATLPWFKNTIMIFNKAISKE